MNKPNQVEDLFRKQFQDFEPKPSQGLWQSIEQQLSFKSFFKFALSSMNIYYAAAIVVSLVGVSILGWDKLQTDPPADTPISNPPQQEMPLQPESSQAIPSIHPNTYTNENTTSISTADATQAIQPANQTPISLNKQEPTLSNEPQNQMDNSALLSQSPTISSNERSDLHQPIEEATSSIVAASNRMVDNSIDKKTITTEHSTTLADRPEAPSSTGTIISNVPEPPHDVLSTPITLPDAPGESTNPLLTNAIDQHFFLSFLEKRTTNGIPLIPYNVSNGIARATDEAPRLYGWNRRYSPWSFDLSTQPSSYAFTYRSDDPILENALNGASQNGRSFNLELTVNYQYREWLFQSGIAWTGMQEDFNFLHQELITSTHESWDVYAAGSETLIDTLYWGFVFDSLASAYYYQPYTADSSVMVYDSTLVVENITSVEEQLYQHLNQYHYLEIPIHVNRNVLNIPFGLSHNGFLHVGLRAGARFGFFIKAQGLTLHRDNEIGLLELESPDLPYLFSRIHLDFGVPLQVPMSPTLHILFEPTYRMSVHSIFGKGHDVQVSQRGPGLKIGLRYFILRRK